MKGDRTSPFFTIFLPLLLCGIIYYAYSKGGFFSNWVRGIIDPLIAAGQWIVNTIFGTSFG